MVGVERRVRYDRRFQVARRDRLVTGTIEMSLRPDSDNERMV